MARPEKGAVRSRRGSGGPRRAPGALNGVLIRSCVREPPRLATGPPTGTRGSRAWCSRRAAEPLEAGKLHHLRGIGQSTGGLAAEVGGSLCTETALAPLKHPKGLTQKDPMIQSSFTAPHTVLETSPNRRSSPGLASKQRWPYRRQARETQQESCPPGQVGAGGEPGSANEHPSSC